MLRGVLLYKGEDGKFVVEIPSLPGCISQGDTEAEARMNILDALAGWLSVQKDDGEKIPKDHLRNDDFRKLAFKLAKEDAYTFSWYWIDDGEEPVFQDVEAEVKEREQLYDHHPPVSDDEMREAVERQIRYVILHTPKATETQGEFHTPSQAQHYLESGVGDEFDVQTVFIGFEDGTKHPVGIYWMGQYYPVKATVIKPYAVVIYYENRTSICIVHRADTLESARHWIETSEFTEKHPYKTHNYAEIVEGEIYPASKRKVIERYLNRERLDT